MEITFLSHLLLNYSNDCKSTAKVAGTFVATKSSCNITALMFCILTVRTAVAGTFAASNVCCKFTVVTSCNVILRFSVVQCVRAFIQTS